ncbi:MAG: ATP-binding protein [Planctomycetota bacterium]
MEQRERSDGREQGGGEGRERTSRLHHLVGGFAHEIKNPLSTIGLNLRLLEEDLAGPESPRDKRILERTRRLSKEVARLQGILQSFLDYVRAPRPVLAELRLNELVREIADLVGPTLEAGGVRLGLFLAEELPPLLADRTLLHQALLNLVTNAEQALAAAGAGGEILVSTGWEDGPGGGRHFVSVLDNGPGMDEATRERCFHPYFSTKRGGAGLGLAITRRFVEDHDGTIEVESDPGHGTRFTVRLPSRGPAIEEDA